MAGDRYFDDIPVGFTFVSDWQELPLEDILEFARKWDPQPFHIDPEAAAQTPYGGIIASGFHTILIAFGLTLQSQIFNTASLGSPGMSEVQWLQPVRPGDRLQVRGEVLEARASASRPDRGFTTVRYDVFNQDEVKVASYTTVQILARKPAG